MEDRNTEDYGKLLRELLEQKQYTKLRQEVADMNVADVAAVMDEMEDEESLRIFRILPKGIAADVFANLEIEVQQYIIQSLSDKEASSIIDNLMADDATDLLEEMPANIVKKILKNAKPETRKDINHLLRYPEDSAGSIMTVEYVDLKENMTVSDAVDRIRKIGLDSETVNICYVVNAQRVLIGTVALRYLVILNPDAIIGEVMNDNVISINTLTDQEEAARIRSRYHPGRGHRGYRKDGGYHSFRQELFQDRHPGNLQEQNALAAAPDDLSYLYRCDYHELRKGTCFICDPDRVYSYADGYRR